jgi:hypothetical protein
MTFTLKKTALAALVAAGALAATVGSASAYIVCNDEGDCWHVHDQYTYPTGMVVHDDAWKWDNAATVHYRWHEHDGRGYWHNGLWVTF